MGEFLLFLIFLFLIRLLHRAARQPERSVRIDVYHHLPPPGPGEREPAPLTIPEAAGKVVPPPGPGEWGVTTPATARVPKVVSDSNVVIPFRPRKIVHKA